MADSASRRDFLKGKAAVGALRDRVGELVGEAPAEPGPVLTLRRRAMACDFEVRTNASRGENATDAGMAALDLVEQLEAQLTVYRPDSEVMAINRSAAEGAVGVEPRLFEVLAWMDRLHTLSGGAYDGTSGPLSAAWGFSRREGRVPSGDELAEALAVVGWSSVELDPQNSSIRFRRPGVQVNLNSVGKGYALDRAAERLLDLGQTDFLLHGGRSTLVARGARRLRDEAAGDESAGDGWGVGLQHPLRPTERIAAFRLRDEAFSTSGSGTQGFVQGGRRYGHLLDPRTGWPAEGLHSVSVLAPTGREADALSTALFVLGPEAGRRLLANQPEWKALFVAPGDSRGEVKLLPVNLADDQWQPL